jgi:serine/threonine protein phosphatase PrpC
MTASLSAGARAFAVCDGFGTVDGVRIEEAALRQLLSLLQSKARSPRFVQQFARPKAVTSMLVSIFSRLNSQLYLRGASHDDYVTCGASLTLALIFRERAYLAADI